MRMSVADIRQAVEHEGALIVRQGESIDLRVGKERTFVAGGKIWAVLVEIGSNVGETLNETDSPWLHMMCRNPDRTFNVTKPKALNDPSQNYAVYKVENTY